MYAGTGTAANTAASDELLALLDCVAAATSFAHFDRDGDAWLSPTELGQRPATATAATMAGPAVSRQVRNRAVVAWRFSRSAFEGGCHAVCP